MVNSDGVRFTFLLRKTLQKGRHHAEVTVTDMTRLFSPHHGYGKRHWSPFAAQPLSKVCCTNIAAHVRGTALVLVPNLASKVKMVGFPNDRGNGTLLWWKRHLPKNTTKGMCTVHALSLHPYWGSAKKRLYKTFKAFINTSRCERLFEMRNTRVYNATPWRELKCKTLGVAIPGSWFHHPLCPTALLHPTDEQQVGWCNVWMLTASFSSR
jgi:hypothetical protein